MKKILFIISLLALVNLTSQAKAEEINSTMNSASTVVHINTEAKKYAEPDLAIISGGIETEDKKADQAFLNNSLKMQDIFKGLKAAGIEDKDIQTSNFSLYPFRAYDKTTDKSYIDGYRATNTISIKMKDMKMIGKVVDVLVSNGANNMQGPTFSVEDKEAILNEARIEALKKAQERAELYAQTAGLKVKRIVTLNESYISGDRPRPMLMKAARIEASFATNADVAQVASGEEELGVNLNVDFELVKP